MKVTFSLSYMLLSWKAWRLIHSQVWWLILVVGWRPQFPSIGSSSNFLTWASTSSWALVTNPTAHSRDQPTVAAIFSLLCHDVLCAIFYAGALNPLAFYGCSCTHMGVHRHLTYQPSLPTQRFMANLGFLPQMPFSQDSFLLSSWLAHELLVPNLVSSLGDIWNWPHK